MRDERKEELKRRARRSIRPHTVIMLVLGFIAIIGVAYLNRQFILLDVIVPSVTLTSISTFIGLILVLFIVAWFRSDNKIESILDIVIDNKIILQDGVEVSGLTMDELIKMQTSIRNIEDIVKR